MKFYMMVPKGSQSGGPMLCYQMCHELMKNNQYAKMLVCGECGFPEDVACLDCYKKYGTTHVTDASELETADSVVIMPEEMTILIPDIKRAKIALWWMSVDNYIKASGEKDIPVIKERVDLHLVQSHYAYHYLTEKLGIPASKIIFVSDYIDELFGQFIYPAAYRQNIGLYNPLKGLEDIKPLIDQTPWLKWIPLYHLTEEEMIVLMQTAKVYVDFGKHPGKDRIPREAASCGCCVITNKKGSAAYEEDVPIPEQYKFADVHASYDKIALLLEDICQNYATHFPNFERYRQFIKSEKSRFSYDVVGFIEACSHFGQSFR